MANKFSNNYEHQLSGANGRSNNTANQPSTPHASRIKISTIFLKHHKCDWTPVVSRLAARRRHDNARKIISSIFVPVISGQFQSSRQLNAFQHNKNQCQPFAGCALFLITVRLDRMISWAKLVGRGDATGQLLWHL